MVQIGISVWVRGTGLRTSTCTVHHFSFLIDIAWLSSLLGFCFPFPKRQRLMKKPGFSLQ